MEHMAAWPRSIHCLYWPSENSGELTVSIVPFTHFALIKGGLKAQQLLSAQGIALGQAILW